MPDENQLELFQPQTTNYSGFCLLNVPAGGNRSRDIKIRSKPGTVDVYRRLISVPRSNQELRFLTLWT